MIVYFILAVLPMVLVSLFPNYKNDYKKRKAYCFWFGVFYIFIVGLRSYYLGSADTLGYVNDIPKALVYEHLDIFLRARTVVEIGYNVFVWIIAKVFHHKSALLIITSIVYLLALYRFCFNNSDSPAFSIFLYITIELFLFNLQGMRQSIAMSICLFAYEFIKKRKPIPFFLIIVLAVLFHRSAIVFAPLYFIYGLKVTRNSVLIYILASITAIYASNYIISTANKLFIYGDINRAYTNVAESGGYITLLVHASIIVISLLSIIQFDDTKKGKRNSLLFYVSFLSLICYVIRYFGAREAERISFYYSYAQLALLPNSLSYFNRRNKILVQGIVILVAIIMFFSKLKNNNFIPYRFFWDS